MTTGNSIENAIMIDVQDTISGITEEHRYLDLICSTFDIGIESTGQSLIIEGNKRYDKFVILFKDGREKVLYFDISSFFGKI
jgi:hypothetical protein